MTNMAGDYMYTEEVLAAKPVSRKIEKGLKRLIIIAALILGAEFIWLFAVSPCIPLSTIDVKGFPGLNRETVFSLAGIGRTTSFLTMDVKAAKKTLEAYYLVESAKVVKRFPDRVSIFLEPRHPVAFSLISYQRRILPVYFDKEGIVLQIGNDDNITPSALPLISGLVFEDPSLGMRLPASFCSLFEAIEHIENSAPELLQAISEIRINRKPFDGFDLVLYPVHNTTRVRLENNLNEDTLRYVMLMLDVFENRKGKSGISRSEIDFRSGVASYTVKEAPSGE
jgi:cell division protein FtsQ